MSSREIALWLDERWYQVLSRQWESETVEDKPNDYLNQMIDQLPESVRERISSEIRRRSGRESITAEGFDTMAAARSAQSCKVAAAFDINFDRMEFSTVHPFTGWATYKLNDVSTAVWYAERCGSYEWAVRQARLVEKLAGREICSSGHLSAEDLSPAEEICEMDGHRLNFYLETGFDVDKVFGTRTAKRAEQMNLYANYDMGTGQVCDELGLVLVHASGKEEELAYSLNAVEKTVLLRKMDDYCQRQTGQSLKDYSAQRLAEDGGLEQNYAPKMEM